MEAQVPLAEEWTNRAKEALRHLEALAAIYKVSLAFPVVDSGRARAAPVDNRPRLKCVKCGHAWKGRPSITRGSRPRLCPKCKTLDWYQPASGGTAEKLDSPCNHHWKIEKPNGPTSKAVCKKCEAVKEFANSADFSAWKSAVAPDVYVNQPGVS